MATRFFARTIAHPLYIGSTDGIYMGSRPHRRGFGTFARIVGEHVRSGTLTLEQAVRKVTGLPAERFSLRDRGLLEVGRAADVTVFDPATLADRSTWENGAYAAIRGSLTSSSTAKPSSPTGGRRAACPAGSSAALRSNRRGSKRSG